MCQLIEMAAGRPPSGTVTFLFTDVEGSTRLWESAPEATARAVKLHDDALRHAVEGCGGYVFTTAGDSFAVAFDRADAAVEAAAAAQRGLADLAWPDGVVLTVRMGIHTGEAHERDGDYFGPAVNRAARIMSAGHGGQVLISAVTAEMAGVDDVVDLGEHRLKDLLTSEHLFQLGTGDYPPLRTLETSRHNLPAQRTELLGRDGDLTQVAELIGEHRLVSLTGFGGTGKTRLAIAVAAAVAHRFVRGVYFVDLASLTDNELVGVTAAEAVGISPERLAGDGSTNARAASALAGQDLLLVLDNCEHVIEGVVDFVDMLLDLGDRPIVLATSREALEIDGEHQYRVRPLPLDDGDHAPAIELFVQRARAIGSEVRPGDPAVAEVCRRLDGVPLAIELAAARMATLTASELAKRLDQQLDLLSSSRRQRGRHRSLQAVLEWSWNLLDDGPRALLVQLGVFSGGWSLDAAELVCLRGSSTAVDLETLVATSLVEPISDEEIGIRFRMLEPVRQFAVNSLEGDPRRDELRARHLDWWLARVRARPTGELWLSGDWAAEIARDADNWRSAINWALDVGRVTEAEELVSGSTAFVFDGSGFLIDAAVSRLFELPHEPGARIFLTGALNDIGLGQHLRLAERVSQARSRAEADGDSVCEAVAGVFQGFSTVNINAEAAQTPVETALDAVAQLDDPEIVSLVKGWAAITAFIAGDPDLALRRFDEARAVACGPHSLASFHCLYGEAFVRLALGQIDESATLFRSAAEVLHPSSPTADARALHEVFWSAQRGDIDDVERKADEAIEMVQSGGAPSFVPDVALAVAEMLERVDRPEAAADLVTALHRHPLTHPLIYHRYRQLRERLPGRPSPARRVPPLELHEMTLSQIRGLHGAAPA